jgi:hypothetical protein
MPEDCRQLRQFDAGLVLGRVVGKPHVVSGVAVYHDLDLQPAVGEQGLVGAGERSSFSFPDFLTPPRLV